MNLIASFSGNKEFIKTKIETHGDEITNFCKKNSLK